MKVEKEKKKVISLENYESLDADICIVKVDKLRNYLNSLDEYFDSSYVIIKNGKIDVQPM